REETMDVGLHAPVIGLFRTADPATDPRRSSGRDENPGETAHIRESVLLDRVERRPTGQNLSFGRESETPDQRRRRVGLSAKVVSLGRGEEEPQPYEGLPPQRVRGENERAVDPSTGPFDELPERPHLGRREVVPEEEPSRVERDPVRLGDPHRVLVGGDSEPFRLRGSDGPELFEMPVERVSARNEGSIVLEELPERDQDLPEVDDPPDPRTKLLGP